MNIKQNVMFHTRITHDKFRSYKIQNGHQSAILLFFSLSRKSSMIADLCTSASHSHQITPGDFWGHFDSHIINPLITRATNKEILVAHFRKKFPADFLFIW